MIGPRWDRTRSALRQRLMGLARSALPQSCALCGGPAHRALVCPDCTAALPRLQLACPVCALPGADATICSRCRARPPAYAATVAPFVYGFPVDRLLQRLKYSGQLAFADWAAAEVAEAIVAVLEQRESNRRPDVVTALPLAAPRQRQRGFNQSQEIAQRVARRLALPLAALLERVRSGQPQAALPWSERAANVRRAFVLAAGAEVRGRSVALVDDVMTTGATLAEAAGELRRGGATRVECWVVARTPPPT